MTIIGANASMPRGDDLPGQQHPRSSKRAFSSGIFVDIGGISGMAGSLVFQSQSAPRHEPGIYASLASQGDVTVGASMTTIKLWRKKEASY